VWKRGQANEDGEKGRHGIGSKDLDVQMQNTEHFFFLFMAFFFVAWPENGGKYFRIVTSGEVGNGGA
jgi:hypothetical protein